MPRNNPVRFGVRVLGKRNLIMLAEPQCSKRKCKHFIGVKSDSTEMEPEKNERVVCEAFPDGIPAEIAYGRNKHLKPFPGDNGIQYEKEGV